MPSNKKIRVFAGPNGSGKSTLQKELSKTYFSEIFINADEIERKLKDFKLIDLNDFGIIGSEESLAEFSNLPDSISLIEKASADNHKINITISENCIVDHSTSKHTYEGSFIASYIRHLMIRQNKSFVFESVFSHPSKIQELQESINKGYRIYLYFVCIDSPEVNVARVEDRVNKNGHDVDYTKVIQRYYRTLEYLHSILPLCYRAYLFDNSGSKQELIAELYNDEMEIKSETFPNWFLEYVLPYYTAE
ncbi:MULTISPECIES: zeta toxin family protein [Flavobacterium]|uniref:Zeta toxin domain-containing protein n=1 Tax=Flavobacterium bizetiae TaxID=2704140 RepID=A0A6J4GUP2_9FLAO|nr:MULTISPECIES: zeta toxin family protein [Flavobacterium]CAA9203034.1 hypothetical protein FLA105534_04385 [Flavobacterium bizetiae]CAD5344794.1 hypothetical protein FLA105535_04803 [Flavobacterium bizetiae]CAD5348602.1 hypothetical protein FLA105534_02569 [Flavobacterium bizetiae]